MKRETVVAHLALEHVAKIAAGQADNGISHYTIMHAALEQADRVVPRIAPLHPEQVRVHYEVALVPKGIPRVEDL